jgi:L-asparaginase II
MEPEEVRLSGDGCGVPVFALPLENMALGFARLAAGGAEDFPEDLLEAVVRVRDAMREYPGMVAGTGRFDTGLMEVTDLVAKSGAEGVFAAASPVEPGWGLALKISDGASRAVAPAVFAALAERGVRVPEAMKIQTVTDLHGEHVGKVAPLTHANLRVKSRRKEPPRKPE